VKLMSGHDPLPKSAALRSADFDLPSRGRLCGLHRAR
jgi:hypothetical protein